MENCTQSRLYHERQVRELCAVHALNNLFQGRKDGGSIYYCPYRLFTLSERLFEKQDLDGFCEELSPSEWINPHRSILGLGNYDVNVLIKALQTRGCDFEWFDKRKDPNSINIDDKVVGFILNVPTEYKFGFLSLPLQRRHWISIRRVDSRSYYSFDSKLKEPIKIGEVRLGDYSQVL